MKFSTKLILSFSCVIALLLAIGLASKYLNEQVKDKVVAESAEAVKQVKLSGEMRLSLYQSIVNIQYLLEDRYRKSQNMESSHNDLNGRGYENIIHENIGRFKDEYLKFEVLLKAHSVNHLQEGDTVRIDEANLEKLDKRFGMYASLVEQFLELVQTDYSDGKEFFSTTIEPYFRSNLLPVVETLRDQAQFNLDREIDHLDKELQRTSDILSYATIGALALSLLLIWFLYQSVAYPIKKLGQSAQRLGQGDLEERISLPSNDEIGQLGKEFNRMAENLSKITVSKNFVDDIIGSMAEALLVGDNGYIIQRANSSALEMLGYSEEGLIGQSFAEILDEKDFKKILQADISSIRNFESIFKTKEGSEVLVSLSFAQIHGAYGNRHGFVCVASDITQRKEVEQKINKSLREKEVLLAEIHHRVKNNLAVISGLLQMQIWETNSEDAEIALKDSQLRVQSIALVHEKLYQSESLSYIEFDQYINDLLQAIRSTYMNENAMITIKSDLQKVALNINQAIPCSLLLNELVVNAYKHAYKDVKEGHISVKLWEEEGRVNLTVKDDGQGLPDDFNIEGSSSLGMTLINTLTAQLDGEMNMVNNGGACFQLSFKAEEAI